MLSDSATRVLTARPGTSLARAVARPEVVTLTSRVCPKPGCPVLLGPGEQCPTHSRPNSHRRGYDRQHRRTRASWAPAVATGTVWCTRPECGQLIGADEPWDLGHDDFDRRITRGPEHANGCNRAAAGRSSQSGHYSG